MKKTILALRQTNLFSTLLNPTARPANKPYKPFLRFICLGMVAFTLLIAQGRIFAQCPTTFSVGSDIGIPNLSGAPAGLANMTGGTVKIWGSFTVDVGSWQMKGVTVYLRTIDAAILVDNNCILDARPNPNGNVPTEFETCPGIPSWSGIQVSSGGTAFLIDCNIFRACTAIDLLSGSKAQITGNSFTDNSICISANGAVTLLGNGISHNDLAIVSSDCSSSPKAIQLEAVPFIAIGNQSQTGSPNTIRNYAIGIDAENSNFDLYNTVFRENSTGLAIDLDGIGGTFNANIFGLGSSELSVPITENYSNGVISNNYNLKIQNAFFKNGVQHIQLTPRQGVTILPVSLDISNNRFELFAQGAIYCIQAKFNRAAIQNNTILDNLDDFMIGQTRYGIRWRQNTMTGLNRAQIVNNTIRDVLKTSSPGASEYWRHHGIQVSQSTQVNVELNLLYQDYPHIQPGDTRSYEGIGLFSSPFNEVRYNQVTSGGPSMPDFFVNKGIYVSESGNNLISCNDVAGFYNGFDFHGPMCDKTKLKSNTIEGDNATGLFLSPGTIIGQQSMRFNAWPGNGTTEALFDGDPDPFFVTLSKFTISTSNTNSTFWANPRVPAVGWFVPPVSEPNPSPSSEACYLNDDPPKSGADELAITGGFQVYKGYPASLWEAQLNAFGTLSNHPELLVTGSPDLQFYNVHDQGNIGKLSRAVKAWEGISRFNTSFESTWSSNQTSIAQKLEEIRAKALEMSQAQTAAQQEQTAQEVAALEAALLTLQQTNQSLSVQYQTNVSASATQLLGDLGNINATEVWETNLKTVLTLLAQQAGSENSGWTTAEQNTLQAIADQCRFAGGIGVVLARAAIEKIDYNDQAMCPGYGERSSTAATLNAKFSPNPSSDFCTITFDLPTSANLFVSDLQGSIIKILDIKESFSYILDTGDLANGLYMISVLDSHGRQFVSKMAVLR